MNYVYTFVCIYIYRYICGEDFDWFWSFKAESNESPVGGKINKNALVGPRGLMGRALMGQAVMGRALMASPRALVGLVLVGPVGRCGLPGPLWAGPLWAPWARMGRALMGLPWPLWAGPSWARP